MTTAPNQRGLWLALGWLLVLAVVYFSLTPAPPTGDIAYADKIGHLAAYAGLMAWWHQVERDGWRLAALFLALGLVLEILQSQTGYRQGDLFDMAANALGVGLGWLLSRGLAGWLPGWTDWRARRLGA